MRRVILFHFFITMAFIANAQLFNPYFQIEAGIAVNREKTGVFRTEVGATFNWLDVGLVLDRESNSFFIKVIWLAIFSIANIEYYAKNQ